MSNPNIQVPYEYIKMAPQKRTSIYNFTSNKYSFLQKQHYIRNASLNIFLIKY